MDLTNIKQIKSLCRKYNIKPHRESGQNFLIDSLVLDEIVKVADLKSTDIVLEVGPGFGVLTQELAKRVKKVIAVEIDKNLIVPLKEILAEFGFKPYIRYNIRVKNPNNSISIENRLDINGKKNFKIWMESIGSNNPKFLTKVDIWKKLGYCPPYTNIKKRLEILKNK